MTDICQILNMLNASPSVELLRLRNREMIVEFLVQTFINKQVAISSENIHTQLADFLEGPEVENDEDSEISAFDTYETKAKKYLSNWTNKGFLTNYPDEQGEVFYELSAHSSKTIDWLASLKKEEFVEFTNEDTEKRIQLLKEKKLEIEQQIQRIKIGEDVNNYSLFQFMGFPRPIEAELDTIAVGGIRKAIFARGLYFTETVTRVEPNKILTFDIKADPNSIPPKALDEHVTVGGKYFNVLEGKYEIKQLQMTKLFCI